MTPGEKIARQWIGGWSVGRASELAAEIDAAIVAAVKEETERFVSQLGDYIRRSKADEDHVIAAAVAEEREACAILMDPFHEGELAAAIRARGATASVATPFSKKETENG